MHRTPRLLAATLPLLLPLILAGCQAHVAPAPPPATAMAPAMLHSPWDVTPVVATDIPYDCGPVIAVGPDITVAGHLDTGKNHLSEDVKAAVYSQSTDAVLDLASAVVRAADTYRATGSRAAAGCVTTMLALAGNTHAMLGYVADGEPWAERSHALNAAAIAYLKVRDARTASPADTDAILNWLEDITRLERTHYEHTTCNGEHCYLKNHKGLQVAMVSAAVGIAANDNSLFHWAVSEYRSAVGDINDRGMLHYDTSHSGRYAFKNNLRSAADLVQIAEFAEINGQPLYGYDGGAIHLLIHTVALGIVSPNAYKAATGSTQLAPSTVEPWEIAWAAVYNRRFPDPLVTSLLHQVGPGGADMWGGEPWDPTGDPEPGL